MEGFVDSKKVKEIGVADLDLNQLSQLHEWSKVEKYCLNFVYTLLDTLYTIPTLLAE